MTDDEAEIHEQHGQVVFTAERVKAFTDAVVAIAMTLLILPLLESVSDAASDGGGAAHWLDEHSQQVFSFVLSFALIAMFWIIHHRLFAGVDRVSNALIWMMALWMLTIVWLPVPTAMSGQMSSTDGLVKTMYIGSLIATSVASLLVRLYLTRRTDLHRIPATVMRRGVAVDLSLVLLFAVALTLTLVFPVLSYYTLFVMLLTGPVQDLFARMLGVAKPKRNRMAITRD